MTGLTQLPLAVHLPDDETFSSFHTGDNATVIMQLESFLLGDPKLPSGFYLFGNKGVGKSHLLHASCAFATENQLTSLCLSLSELKNLSVEVLDGLENIDLICLDDLQLIVADHQWQQAVFDLYNRLLENNKRMIITGNDSAGNLGLTLPDLVSRISWGLTEQVKPLSDQAKIDALQNRARLRGIDMSDEVTKFLLNRLSRDMTNLIQSLDKLDKASIREQRKITIPFIKSTLFGD